MVGDQKKVQIWRPPLATPPLRSTPPKRTLCICHSFVIPAKKENHLLFDITKILQRIQAEEETCIYGKDSNPTERQVLSGN